MNKCAKTLCIVALLLFVFNTAKAQYYYFNEVNKFSVGVNVGTNMSTAPGLKATKGDVVTPPSGEKGVIDQDFKTKSKFGFTANINVDYNFPNGLLTLSTGLGASTKQVKIDGGTDRKLDAYFLTLPVHLLYNVQFGEKNTLQIGGGPYVAYGLGGSYKDTSNGINYHTFRGDQVLMNRFDFGLGLSARVTLSEIFQMTVGYDLGLKNLMKSTQERIENVGQSTDIVYIDKARFNSLYLTIGVKLF